MIERTIAPYEFQSSRLLQHWHAQKRFHFSPAAPFATKRALGISTEAGIHVDLGIAWFRDVDSRLPHYCPE